MPVKLLQVDAFTNQAFKGNPAAVCLLSGDAGEEWMQSVAREMNLSETAFVVPQGVEFALRWFTPTAEVDLCGHATLAAAHALWEWGLAERETEVVFNTKSGKLTASWADGWVEMDFPAEPVEKDVFPTEMARALGSAIQWVGKNRLDYLVELQSDEAVRELEPNISALADLDARGLIVTARAEYDPFDFVSRYFAPAFGIDEDPVTGSAHCALVPYWAAKLGKTEMIGLQVSVRGGVVKTQLRGDRVTLAGQAVTTMRGELLIDP